MASKKKLAGGDVIAHGTEQVFTVVDGQAVLMSVQNGKYYKLDEIGTRIWSILETPSGVGALCLQLIEEFHVEPEKCTADVHVLLSSLLENGLIRVVPGPS